MTPGEHGGRMMTKTGAFKWNWSILVVFVFFCVATLVNVGYTNSVQHQSNKQHDRALAESEQVWCGILLLILKTPTVNSPIQIEFRKKMAILATAYGCQGVPQKPLVVTPTARPGNASPSTTGTASP